MPQFFFNLFNHETAIDPEGREFADLAAARENAIFEAREVMKESLAKGRINLSHRIDIADAAGWFWILSPFARQLASKGEMLR